MKNIKLYYFLSVLGLLMLAVGLYLIKALPVGSSVKYLLVGAGCGIFGHGVGEILNRRAIAGSPEISKQIEIETNDERNILLANKAKAKAYNIMLPLFGALFMAFSLMGVELRVILLLVAAYLFVCFSSIYYRIKYEKEM